MPPKLFPSRLILLIPHLATQPLCSWQCLCWVGQVLNCIKPRAPVDVLSAELLISCSAVPGQRAGGDLSQVSNSAGEGGIGVRALFPHSPWAKQGTVSQLCLQPSSPVQHWADSSSRALNWGDPYRPPHDSCSPAEIKSQQLQLMKAAIWASKEISPSMPSFWLPSVHPPELLAPGCCL